MIENLFKPELIQLSNKSVINDFIKNTYSIFEKKPQKDQIIESYKKMNIKVDNLEKKKSDDSEDESDSN